MRITRQQIGGASSPRARPPGSASALFAAGSQGAWRLVGEAEHEDRMDLGAAGAGIAKRLEIGESK